MADAQLLQRAKILLDRLSEKPRFAGSAEESNARAMCRAELESSGFACRELTFEYSQAPGRWGPPLSAALQVATIFIVADTANFAGPFSALLIGATLLGILSFGDARAKQRSITNFRFQRARSVNLEARRGNPRVWLVAHLDSKSQTVPMLIRIASSVALVGVMMVAVAILILLFIGVQAAAALWPAVETAAIVAALPSLLCFVRNNSLGAVDNSSGVAAVLLASQSASSPPDLGVLITSGEELGLAGARVWAPSAPVEAEVLNCDTVDDAGVWRCMYTGPRPKRIGAAVASVSSNLSLRLPFGRLIPGILADSIAFADWGIEAITLSRGSLATLARIHTRRDTSSGLAGSGVAEASGLLSTLAKE